MSAEVFKESCAVITGEIQNICSSLSPSILRKKSKPDLQNFSWDIVYSEFQKMCPHFCQFLEAAMHNPSAVGNKVKTHLQIRNAMCSAGCKLLSIFNDDMSALRHINSILLKKGGLKKSGFIRMCASYDTMSYMTANRIQESFGKDHDSDILSWKNQIAIETENEGNVLQKLNSLHGQAQDAETKQTIISLTAELEDLRKSMHPGYDLVGDNVDMKTDPRQMTSKHQRKNYHLFNIMAYQNRIGANDLSDEAPQKISTQ